jgi:hypothetical protein
LPAMISVSKKFSPTATTLATTSGEHKVVGRAETLAENGFHGTRAAGTGSARYSTNDGG